jgi:hypothetical protein
MTLRHGTLSRYNSGCRCGDCVYRNSSYRQQRRAGLSASDITAGQEPGRVELGVREEIALAVESRPGLAAMAVALAQLLDNPRATNQYPAAAKVLTELLDELGKVGAPRRRSHLALVREMTENGGA